MVRGKIIPRSSVTSLKKNFLSFGEAGRSLMARGDDVNSLPPEVSPCISLRSPGSAPESHRGDPLTRRKDCESPRVTSGSSTEAESSPGNINCPLQEATRRAQRRRVRGGVLLLLPGSLSGRFRPAGWRSIIGGTGNNVYGKTPPELAGDFPHQR